MDLNHLRENRISAELYYKTNPKNQLYDVATPPASGYFSKFINAGNVQNSGIEITLNVMPIKRDFRWNFYINYAKNKNKVISIYPGSPEFELNTDGFMTRTKVVEGRPFGEMYSRGYVEEIFGDR